MSTLTEASDAPVVRVVNDVTHEFPKLTRDQVGVLIAKWSAEDRVRLLKSLKVLMAAGFSEDVRADKLLEFDRRVFCITYILRCTEQSDRVEEVLRLSAPDIDPSFLATLDAMYLAREIIGWKDEASADPNRTEPQASPAKE